MFWNHRNNVRNRMLSAVVAISMLLALLPAMADDAGANEGGACTFGYTWTDSLLPAPTVGYDWIEISGTGTNTGVTGDDSYGGPYMIGFDFSFFGNTYNEFYVSTNGIITFGSGSTTYSNQNIPVTTNPDNLLAVYWDDMCVDYSVYNNGIIYYETRGASPNQQLVVEWWEISRLGTYDLMTFEAVLNETGEIWFQYATLNGMTGSSATVGIENVDGTDACSYSYNTASLSDNMSVRFTLPPVTIESDQEGYALPGEDEPYTLTVTNNLGFTDSFDLTAVSENGWTVTFYDSTGTVPLVDTNGDPGGHPDTGDIAAGSSVTIVAKVTVPMSPGVSSDVTNVTATSFINPMESDMCTLTTHVLSQLGSSHGDHGQDDTGNGKFDWLVIEAEVNVSVAGTFNVLCDMYNQAVTIYVTSGSNNTALGAGLQTVWIFLDGMTINSRGVDGPYTVYLYLYDEFWNFHDSATYLTAAYSADDFQCMAEFEPPHSDSGNDTDALQLRYDVFMAAVEILVFGQYRGRRLWFGRHRPWCLGTTFLYWPCAFSTTFGSGTT